MEDTAIQVTMAGRPVKILAVYLFPSRPLIGAVLTACFGGGLPVLMAGDLNAKHVDWNSRMTTRRRILLRAYAGGNSCPFGPGIPTTNPYNPSVTPDVLDIVLTQNLSFKVYLASCSVLSSDHLPVLIGHCESLFLSSPIGSP
jgi:endonuclease/exonuclease/phosphatase family metal-dependent hydrolase